MWAGNPQYSQWALNPSAYQNVSHEEVDWAALAQQWIQMKETLPAGQIPSAPPPPTIKDEKNETIKGGLAPMDVVAKEEVIDPTNAQDSNSWNSWQAWQQQWNWGWPGANPTTAAAAAAVAAATTTATPAVPRKDGTQPYPYVNNQQQFPAIPGTYEYNHMSGTDHYNQTISSNFWPGPEQNAMVAQGEAPPPPFIRQNRADWRRNNVRGQDRSRSAEKQEEPDAIPVLDAAKRRQLPAWIREGLEKMEREKQKKIDKERETKEREEYLQKKREEEENAMRDMENNSGHVIPKKSKFDSESDSEGDKPIYIPKSPIKRRSRFRNADSPNMSPNIRTLDHGSSPEPKFRSREEILQDMMIKVRRMLTEILLEVTTEEMNNIAQEELVKAKAKAPVQLKKTQALASLTGKLGLGMYGDSDSESGEENEKPSNSFRNSQAPDSDEELKEKIRSRKRMFAENVHNIEKKINEEEEHRLTLEKKFMGLASEESEDEERQVENETDSKHLGVNKGSSRSHEDDDYDEIESREARSSTDEEVEKKYNIASLDEQSDNSKESIQIRKSDQDRTKRKDIPRDRNVDDREQSSEEDGTRSESSSSSDSGSSRNSSSSDSSQHKRKKSEIKKKKNYKQDKYGSDNSRRKYDNKKSKKRYERRKSRSRSIETVSSRRSKDDYHYGGSVRKSSRDSISSYSDRRERKRSRRRDSSDSSSSYHRIKESSKRQKYSRSPSYEHYKYKSSRHRSRSRDYDDKYSKRRSHH